jgi:hyperosmotically inducible protein
MMKSLGTHAAIVLVVLTTVVGCRTATGQSLGASVDDATTTATVKAKLAADHPRDLTAVDVDTINGTVYLKGNVASEAEKDRAAQLARSVSGVRAVVDNLQVRTTATSASPSASPRTTGDVLTRVMSGQVTSVDPATGALGLKTAEGDMLLQFPRAVLGDMHVGDQVTVQIDRTPAR